MAVRRNESAPGRLIGHTVSGRPAANLYYVRARYYDPATGPRFSQRSTFSRSVLSKVRLYNSLEAGIANVNTRIGAGRLKVFRTCTNLIKELGLYRYPDESERKLVGEKPIDAHNHACAALRYLVHELDRFRRFEAGSSAYVVLPEKPPDPVPPDYETDYRRSPPQQRYQQPPRHSREEWDRERERREQHEYLWNHGWEDYRGAF